MNQSPIRPRTRKACALAVCVLLGFTLAGCQHPDADTRRPDRLSPTVLTVFAAASLTDAFSEMERMYETAHPGTNILLNLAGSQQLAQQLRLGAPADVFACANIQQMDTAIEAGRITRDTQMIFALNRLVVVTPADNPAALLHLQDLARPGLRLVLAAEVVPVGAYTLEFLENANRRMDPTFRSRVLANVVSLEQNVRAVLTKVVLGEADAGIVYASDLQRLDAVHRIEIPDSLNVPARYTIAPVADSHQPAAARAFIAFVTSPEGRTILEAHGFGVDDR